MSIDTPITGPTSPASAGAALDIALSWAAGVATLIMMVASAADAGARYLWGTPIIGMTEFVAMYLMVALIWLALPYVELTDRSVAVDLLMSKAPATVQLVVEGIGRLIAAATIALIAWHAFHTGLDLLGRSTSGVVRIPTAPPRFLLAVGAGLLSLRLVLRALGSFRSLLQSAAGSTRTDVKEG